MGLGDGVAVGYKLFVRLSLDLRLYGPVRGRTAVAILYLSHLTLCLSHISALAGRSAKCGPICRAVREQSGCGRARGGSTTSRSVCRVVWLYNVAGSHDRRGRGPPRAGATVGPLSIVDLGSVTNARGLLPRAARGRVCALCPPSLSHRARRPPSRRAARAVAAAVAPRSCDAHVCSTVKHQVVERVRGSCHDAFHYRRRPLTRRCAICAGARRACTCGRAPPARL